MSALSPGDALLVAVSAALGSRRPAALTQALSDAVGHPEPHAVEEALLQSYLFLGYPAALNAFGEWRRVSGRSAGSPSGETGPWSDRGAQVCQAVYGGQYQRLRENIRALHPDMERWMVDEGYGKVLGRPGLPLVTRELCIGALLAALDAPRQLYAHLRGALNAGADPAQVDAALELAAVVSDEPVRARAAETWASLQARTPQER